ncbi:MAG: ABC transporter ATP-binding protein [Firmicutes bacterium]|nr:ABC transporter ATP-binding protein [Bacillota bacterium]
MKDKYVHDEYSLSKGKRTLFARLLGYFIPYLPLMLLSILFAFLINGAVLIKPYIIKYVIDDYLAVGKNDPNVFMLMGLIYLGVVLLGAGFGYSQTYLLTYIGQKIMYDIRNQLFTHIQNMSMKFFDRNSSGRILTRVTNDVEALNEIFSGVLVNFIRDFIMIVGIIIAMFSMNKNLALLSICSVPLIAIITVIYRKAARKNFIKMKGLIARINGFLAENISGMKLVRIFHREKEKFEEFEKLDKEYFATSLREVILNSLCRPIVEIINTLTVALLIWYCSGRVTEGYLEIGVLYAFITYIRQFFGPINEISENYTSIQSALVSSERIFDILDNRELLEDIEGEKHIDKLRGEIEFKNVWFAYNEGEWVLKDVSFKIRQGETVAFVGATGSGKSTIINLMARFYNIQKGEILIDGINIKEYNLKDLRRQIAVVMQDVFLFSGDIKSNIRLKNSVITDDDIVYAAKLVCADKFIESLPNKYDEEVKERGCTFSAGQRQLISFARAVAFRPAVFVLDEATANIDTETETAIQSAMANISGGSTTIIIAHRLSTIRNADKIIVINKGRVEEMGTHEELLNKGGIYSQLYEKQQSYQRTA